MLCYKVYGNGMTDRYTKMFLGKMKFIIGLWLLALLNLVACSPQPTEEFTPLPPQTSQVVRIEEEDTDIMLTTPSDWYIYNAANRIVLSEAAQPIAADGSLDGITITISVPMLNTDNASLQSVLQQVISSDALRDTASTSPQSFVWGQYDAGYYVVNVGNDKATLVIVLILDDEQALTITASAAHDEFSRLRDTLIVALDDLHIDNIPLESDELRTLPSPLNIPALGTEAAMEASAAP